MYGVVLWSDHSRNRAVIWCEDHGDLAYFDGGLPAGGPGLEPGDLVRFEVSEGKRMRIVSNPRVVASEQYPSLASDLRRAGTGHGTPMPQAGDAPSSKIIPLTPGGAAVQAATNRKTSTG
ncbi:hypothetical protein [Roseovarius sp. MMSF_3281]|uniref:hypothetical protein n=1 Tax=Roseovarius sp. MMSF_3281 TaxID=3046694 RepID=UPI00273E5686|nr:hypothetical protein [Roseovarius sp. MMSF_3281]